MNKSTILISVVIGTFNQLKTLQLVLPEYEKQTLEKEKFEVILVDSSSTDGSIAWYKNFKPSFNFTAHVQINNGKAAARNKGVSLAKGKYIIVTDGDMIPDSKLLKTHLNAHQKIKKPVCYEGLAWNMDKLEWPINKAQLLPQVGKERKHLSKLGWFYFLTGNISFPKSLFDTYNGFNELFLSYGWEDLELGYRLAKNKIPLYYLKDAINYHYHVVSNEEEIERNVKKGESAKLLLDLHPELKLFCGLNPISKAIFPMFNETGKFYQFLMEKGLKSNLKVLQKFSFWFLKEHQYMKGILSV